RAQPGAERGRRRPGQREKAREHGPDARRAEDLHGERRVGIGYAGEAASVVNPIERDAVIGKTRPEARGSAPARTGQEAEARQRRQRDPAQRAEAGTGKAKGRKSAGKKG